MFVLYIFFKLLASYREFALTGLEGETASRASVGGHRRIATLTPNGAKRRMLGHCTGPATVCHTPKDQSILAGPSTTTAFPFDSDIGLDSKCYVQF